MADTLTAADIRSGRLSDEVLKDNFSDLHPRLDPHEAAVEADRCYFCYDAPCMTACSTSIDIPQFIRQISTGNPNGAAKTIFAENILGGMCARVCPTETLCEEACVREKAEGKPVRIGELQRFATDHFMETKEGTSFTRAAETGKRIAVVGAGPAGLSCAHRLASHGHQIDLFEAKGKMGGLNEYGIAAYKSTNDFAQKEVEWLLSIGGITVHSGMALGRDLSLERLQADYDAVFLSIGLGGVNALRAEGENLENVEDAVDYIEDLRQASDLSKLPVGRDVVVIGGGMTAVDIAVQSKLLGAENVTIAYRRGPDQMGASKFEQDLAQTNGVAIKFWSKPFAIKGEGGQVSGIELERTELNENGRLLATGDIETIPADMVFKAVGQTLVTKDIAAEGEGLALEGDRIKVDEQRKTSLTNVWAGGDCVAGGEDLTVAAVEDGKVAAEAINAVLTA
ncbi:NAD(P)-dependent oxidoreductase [Rhodobacteraceae bacterium RKSG542]|uniref:NAD(P)-dependent oxidoreductase n=1 Tax=Pseudovibrio flavus TaxID=2529854 RepID=UPI0012BB709F|nr:NAD(P)-dependent oxidoreductase [Pseudovibrio flavus]MTI19098.1 NAD(P)-dependent oxidoreductase [Pseudovibrio flavus]